MILGSGDASILASGTNCVDFAVASWLDTVSRCSLLRYRVCKAFNFPQALPLDHGVTRREAQVSKQYEISR